MDFHGHPGQNVRFGSFTLDVRSGELHKGPTRLKVPNQSIEILKALLERHGELVEREYLRRRLWAGDTFVDFEHGLNAAMRRLREALGDSADTPRFIETLPRRGYRFIGTCDAARRSSKVSSLVVLPFVNELDDGAQYLADGMTESIGRSFSLIRSLRVIASRSAARYHAGEEPVRQIAQELSVDAVMRGTISQSDAGVCVEVVLFEGSTGESIWTGKYDRSAGDLQRVPIEIVDTIATELDLELTADERRRFHAHHPRSPAALEDYLRGRYHWGRETTEGLEKSFEYLSAALEREPDYAACHAALADWYLSAGSDGVLPIGEAIQKAKAQAEKAIALDGGLAEAHASLGRIAIFEWDLQKARSELDVAMGMNPNLVEPVILSARALSFLSLHDEAIKRAQLAKQLDPVSPRVNLTAAVVCYIASDYATAVEECRHALEFEPRLATAFYYMGMSQLRLGAVDEALKSLETAVNVGHRHAATLAGLAFGLAQAGRHQEAISVLGEMKERATSAEVTPYYFAEVFLALHDVDKALTYLRRSYDLHIPDMIGVGVDPLFEPLRGHPEFEQILSGLRLARR